jgi:hypothetical protein
MSSASAIIQLNATDQLSKSIRAKCDQKLQVCATVQVHRYAAGATLYCSLMACCCSFDIRACLHMQSLQKCKSVLSQTSYAMHTATRCAARTHNMIDCITLICTETTAQKQSLKRELLYSILNDCSHILHLA